MKKSTFCKIINQLRQIELNQDEVNMIMQALEEDTECALDLGLFLSMSDSTVPAGLVYDTIEHYCSQNHYYKGIQLRYIKQQEIIDHNALVTLIEKDRGDPHYSNQVWKGEFWKVPKQYLNRIAQIKDVINLDDNDGSVYIELYQEVDDSYYNTNVVSDYKTINK